MIKITDRAKVHLAYQKIVECILGSVTAEHISSCKRMIENYNNTFDPPAELSGDNLNNIMMTKVDAMMGDATKVNRVMGMLHMLEMNTGTHHPGSPIYDMLKTVALDDQDLLAVWTKAAGILIIEDTGGRFITVLSKGESEKIF